RNSFPCTHAPGRCGGQFKRQGSDEVVSCNAPCSGKSNCVENRFQSFAEIMAADTSWKTRQMSALRSRFEIRNDRRPHFMVLRALPGAKVTQASSLTRPAGILPAEGRPAGW